MFKYITKWALVLAAASLLIIGCDDKKAEDGPAEEASATKAEDGEGNEAEVTTKEGGAEVKAEAADGSKAEVKVDEEGGTAEVETEDGDVKVDTKDGVKVKAPGVDINVGGK